MTTLTEQLEASVNFERIKIRLKDIDRAKSHLERAKELASQLARKRQMIQDYDCAVSDYEPWTLVASKEELIQAVEDIQAAYDRCMSIYNTIVKSL